MIDVARKHQKLMCKGKEHIKHVETFKEVKGVKQSKTYP